MASNTGPLPPLCNPRSRATHPRLSQLAVLPWAALFLSAFLIRGASAQGLIQVPPTVTRELGAYYISKLGLAEGGFDFYGAMSQRNVGSNNAYVQINALSPTDSPREAAVKISNVRAVYSANTLGGKVTVESYYRLLRCEEDTCFVTSRVIAADAKGPYDLTYPMTVVRTTMGSSSLLINAPQGPVNTLLDRADERVYNDPVYKTFTLHYKVTRPPFTPCSSALPLTLAGSISEFAALPGFTCMGYRNISLIVGTSSGLVSMMQENALPWNRCDGSLLLMYDLDSGPTIVRVIRNPGNVPFTVEVDLPKNVQQCHPLYVDGPETTLDAAQVILQTTFNTTVGTIFTPPSIQRLGFNGDCAPTYFFGGYGPYAYGQLEDLPQSSSDPSFLGSFLPYNSDPSQVCVSMFASDQPASRDELEDECAELFFGNGGQLREGIVTSGSLKPNALGTDKSDLEGYCQGQSYNLSITLVLPQIAVDFEAEKNFVLSSTEVRFHLDGVAANAASVLAIEAALATSGILVAQIIARTSLYRRRLVGSSYARASAIITALAVTTIFNIPNFALISRSLSNHGSPAVYTQVSLHNYRPSNYSAELRAETHTFVTVEGSRATAIIGLLLYSATMILCLYLTWTEFTEIIHRREAAESRLGQEALLKDKNLLVQWRDADSMVYDILHPKKVVESAQAHELEMMRRNFAHAAGANANAVNSPRGSAGHVPPSPGARPLSSMKDGQNDVPDLYHQNP